MLGGERSRGANVIRCQMGMMGDDFLLRHAGGDLAENELDRDPRAADDGLPEHDFRVGRDAVVNHL